MKSFPKPADNITMLTLGKVHLYERFNGDMDGVSRAQWGGFQDTSGMTDDDWRTIERLCQGLHLIATGKASKRFGAEIEQALQTETQDEPTREALRRLAFK